MRKPSPAYALPALALLFALACNASAQTIVDARTALTTFPDSQAVLYVNAHRIVNEMLPRILPPAEYRKLLNEAQKAGFDARGLQYAIVGVRFVEPAPANGLPEFVVVVRGDFNADSLLTLARVGVESEKVKHRQETYGSKTLDIIDTSNTDQPAEGGDPSKPEERPKPAPYPEVAATAFDANTIIVGVPAFVKAAIDSASGQGQLKSSTLELASHDPQVLWSLTAEIPPSVVDYMHKFGAPKNDEIDNMIGWMKQISLSQGMNAIDFTFNASLLTDQPEHASAFSGFVRMGLLAAQTALTEEAAKKRGNDAVQARQALAVLRTVVNRTEGSTLHITASIPQQTIANYVRIEMAKKSAATMGKTTRGRTRKGTTRRR